MDEKVTCNLSKAQPIDHRAKKEILPFHFFRREVLAYSSVFLYVFFPRIGCEEEKGLDELKNKKIKVSK